MNGMESLEGKRAGKLTSVPEVTPPKAEGRESVAGEPLPFSDSQNEALSNIHEHLDKRADQIDDLRRKAGRISEHVQTIEAVVPKTGKEQFGADRNELARIQYLYNSPHASTVYEDEMAEHVAILSEIEERYKST